MSYSFTFRGAILENADSLSVARDMAQLFGVELKEVNPLFQGHAVFRRDNLNEIAALAYQDEFNRIGAIGEVEPTSSANGVSEASTSGVDMYSIVDPELANSSAFETRVETKNETNATGFDSKRSREQDSSQKAAFWLKWASVAIIGITIADRYLQTTLIIDEVGMDIGYWPFILAHALLVYGCVLLAKAKGYSPLLGFLGVLSLLGLSILLIIPDKNSETNTVSLATVIFTVFSAVLFFNAVAGLQSASTQRKEISIGADLLHQGRNEYPAPKQTDLQIYASEQAEMASFIENTIDAIDEGGFRPDEVKEISERMFFEFSRYVIWRRYQTFLNSNPEKPLPKGLSKEFQKADEAKFKALLNGRIGHQSPARLREVKDAWFIAPSGIYDTRSPAENLGESFAYLFDAIQEAVIIRSMSSDKAERERVDYTASDIKTQSVSGVSITKTGKLIKFQIEQGQYSGKQLVIGVSTNVRRSRQGKVSSRPRLTVITHEFPVKYLSKLLGVFDGYNH